MRKFNTRILSLLMALVMSFSLVITAFAADTSSTGDDWVIPDGAFLIYDPDDYNPIGYQTADGHVVLFNDSSTWEDTQPTQDAPTDDYDQTQPDSIEIPTDDAIFTDEDLALVTKFKDVKTTAWYYSDVTECAKLGIVAGFEDGSFRPEDKVTAVQWITMITRTFYNAKVEAAQKLKPAGSAWYWANTKVGADEYLTTGMTINDNAMNRYDMANVVKNVVQLINGGAHNPTTAAKNAVPSQVRDWSNVPKNRTVAIKTCYATGLIAGMSDGKFHGEQSMTRAQACTVIMRMLKLINKYNPGDKDNDQYDDGKNQNAGDQNATGKLANGQPATVANVEAILAQIKREYPERTPWGNVGTANNNYYNHRCSSNHDVSALICSVGGATLSLQYGCGGWMCMVSERIFGETGAPAREVTDTSKVRPGDIIVCTDTAGKIAHVAIIEVVEQNPNFNNAWRFSTCDGNTCANGGTGGYVAWAHRNQHPYGTLGTAYSGCTTRAFTRYPA